MHGDRGLAGRVRRGRHVLGASDANYAIGYTAGDLRVDPVLFLAQRGLPDAVRQKVYLDGSSVSLPVVALVVRLGSRHSYRFPTVLLARRARRT